MDSVLHHSNLSNSQLQIWAGQKLDPDIPLYNMALAFFIKAKLDPTLFQDAFHKLVYRSDALRTVITEKDGVPQQKVLDKLNYKMELKDLSKYPDSQGTILSWLKKRTVRKFELEKRLFESVLIKLSEDKYVWYLNQHHLITDVWSCTIVYRKMADFFQLAANDLLADAPELPSYRDYQVYEREYRTSNAYIKAAAYWKKKSSKPQVPLELYGKVLSDTATRTERVFCDIGWDRSEKLRALVQEKDFKAFGIHLSLFNFFAALLFAYLYRISGNTKLVIGTPSHHRHTATFKETIGLFIELFPLEISIAPEESFRSLINTIVPESYEYLRYAQPGTSKIIPGNLYSVVLNYINVSFPDFCGMPVHSIWIHPGHCDRGHALRLQVHDFNMSGSIQLYFDLSCGIFDHDLRQRVPKHFLKLLDAMLIDPDQPIEKVDLLSRDERKALIYGGNQTLKYLPKDKTVIDLLKQQACKTPHSIAIIDDQRIISYGDLDYRSDQIARYLQKAGVVRETMVGLFMERCSELIIAIMGILKAGAAFVPIDVSFPKKRIGYILKDCKTPIVLTQEGQKNRIPDSSAEIVCIDSTWKQISKDFPPLTQGKPKPQELAYVIYTSGSTGQPKGVMIEHGSLVNYLIWAQKQYMDDGPHDFPFFTTIAADLTITSIFLPLISGGRIIVYREPKDSLDLSVLEVFNDDRVDIIKLTPSHLAMMVDQNIPPRRVKKLIVGGEDFKTGLAQRAAGLFDGNIEIFNEYGPTEATVGCMIHRFDLDSDKNPSVAIGKPIDNLQIYLLDAGLNPVPIGVKADIYIAGKGLARGYLNQPELTSEMFLQNPFRPGEKIYCSGDVGRWKVEEMLQFLGRKDHQVKVRGFRIELGEIEGALLEFSGIRDSVARVMDHRSSISHNDILHCQKCGLASNHPQAKLDEHEVCRICYEFEKQKDFAWRFFKTEKEFRRILQHAKATCTGKYDCLMQYSGGKDSTYALYKLVEMGAHPLVFSFDNGYISDGAKENVRRVVEDLKLDLVWGQTPAMNIIFFDSLRRFSNVCNGCQKAINTLSLNLAREEGIRYIITGLSRGQLFETRVSELFHNQIFSSEDIDRNIIEARKAYHRMNDAVSRHLDVSAFIDDAVFEEIQYIDFYRYCNVELHDLLDFLDQRAPWIRPTNTGRSTNCMINEAGIYIHKKERGFHNYALPYSWDVRLGHKNRDSALEELNDDIDETRVIRLLKEIGYDPEEKAYSSIDRRIVAYYVADQDYPPEELRSFLSLSLPSYMIPAHFVRMDFFPLNATGKIERNSLPLPDNVRAGIPSQYIAPRNEVEHLLAGIWAKVIGAEKVGIHDNFFDLGGDSILCIQIVAHANQSDLNLKPRQLFEHQTIAELAAAADETNRIQAEQGLVTGQVPLTPIQHWFFRQNLAESNHWNQTIVLSTPANVDLKALEGAIHYLIQHHDALRLCYQRDAAGWQQMIGRAKTPFVLQYEDLSELAEKEHNQRIEQVSRHLQSTLCIESGDLVRAVLFKLGNDRLGRLRLIIHHLAVDGVSWIILVEDLETAYKQLCQGQPVSLPAKSTSFKQWSTELAAYARSTKLQTELDFWLSLIQTPVTVIPVDFGNNSPTSTFAASRTISIALGARATQSLLHDVPGLYNTQMNDVLLTALIQVFSDWTGGSCFRLDLEGHGRENIIARVDISRTVGWFTTIYPVVLALEPTLNPGAALKRIKEQLRSIPNHGIGYGLLRYLNQDANAQPLEEFSADILFNYLGQLERMLPNSSLFGLAQHLTGSFGAGNKRSHRLNVNAYVLKKQLHVHWVYSTDHYQAETIQELAAAYIRFLQAIIDHCLSAEAGGFTPSDFPLADLDEKKLRRLADVIKAIDSE